MIFRWLYRLSIWRRVMRGLSRLDLSIRPGHPDERYWQAFDKKWAGTDAAPRNPHQIGEADFSGMSDLGLLVRAVREMKTLPITKEGVRPLLVAIVLPFFFSASRRLSAWGSPVGNRPRVLG